MDRAVKERQDIGHCRREHVALDYRQESNPGHYMVYLLHRWRISGWSHRPGPGKIPAHAHKKPTKLTSMSVLRN